ncbi:hypothetical protein [Enterobacter sp. JBIWA003]|nr:hypothetical protein [Enterobacter sp. JBIWA003]
MNIKQVPVAPENKPTGFLPEKVLRELRERQRRKPKSDEQEA